MTSRRLLSVAVASVAVVFGLATSPAVATSDHGSRGYTFAVIGDIPYGSAQIAELPARIAQINADPAVRWVDHLGDIKNGSTVCSDEYFASIKADFDAFEDPLVYTPGDNEWTDCHRLNNGGYNPLERLAAVRSVFFPQPGRTLGQRSARVQSQAALGLPENVRWTRADVAFAALHITGSNNGTLPWTGQTSTTPEQAAEVAARSAAVIKEIRATFADARRAHRRAVVLLTQADMFDPNVGPPSPVFFDAFGPIVATIAAQAASYPGPVYLINGDSHLYNVDQPLAAGSSWLDFYGVTTAADNLTRITVDGSDNATNYLRVTVTGGSRDHHRARRDVLTWERVPYTS